MRWFRKSKSLPTRYAGTASADQRHPAMSVKVDYEPAITIIGTAPDAERAALPALDEVIESRGRQALRKRMEAKFPKGTSVRVDYSDEFYPVVEWYCQPDGQVECMLSHDGGCLFHVDWSAVRDAAKAGPMLTPTLDEVIESCDRFRPADPLEFLSSTLTLSPAGIDVL